MWSIVASPRFSVSLKEIHESWTMCDVWDAAIMLDIYEDIDILSMPKPKKR